VTSIASLGIRVTVRDSTLERFVDVSDESGRNAHDWCNYTGYDNTPHDELASVGDLIGTGSGSTTIPTRPRTTLTPVPALSFQIFYSWTALLSPSAVETAS
jgi:hypothetical protein